jgi:hypothetical protein
VQQDADDDEDDGEREEDDGGGQKDAPAEAVLLPSGRIHGARAIRRRWRRVPRHGADRSIIKLSFLRYEITIFRLKKLEK